jgi:hypothetical protein
MSKSAPIPFKSLNFDATAAAVQRLSHEQNIPALAFPQKAGREGELAVVPVAVKASGKIRTFERLPVHLPSYVITDLKQRALTNETTCRFIIMQALKQHGIHIADADMIPDGRRTR